MAGSALVAHNHLVSDTAMLPEVTVAAFGSQNLGSASSRAPSAPSTLTTDACRADVNDHLPGTGLGTRLLDEVDLLVLAVCEVVPCRKAWSRVSAGSKASLSAAQPQVGSIRTDL